MRKSELQRMNRIQDDEIKMLINRFDKLAQEHNKKADEERAAERRKQTFCENCKHGVKRVELIPSVPTGSGGTIGPCQNTYYGCDLDPACSLFERKKEGG